MLIEEIIGAFTGENRRTRHRQVATAAILGLLAGAAAGLLLAPQSGEETRQDIADFAVKGAGVVKEKSVQAGRKIKETATDVYGKVESTVRDLLSREEVEDVVEDAAKAARAAARDARRKAREKAEETLIESVEEAVAKAEG